MSVARSNPKIQQSPPDAHSASAAFHIIPLEKVAAEIVQECARQENRTASNAASTLIRRAWLARQAQSKNSAGLSAA